METDEKMVLASRLTDGRAVFLGVDGGWVDDIARGAVATTPDAAQQLLAAAQTAEARNAIVEPYLIGIRTVAGHRQPGDFRELIRATGPTVRTDQVRTDPLRATDDQH